MYFIVKLVITLGFVKREERRTKEEGRGGGGAVKLEQRKLVWKFIYIYIYESLFQQRTHREDMDSLLIWFLFLFFVFFLVFGENRKPEDRQGWAPPVSSCCIGQVRPGRRWWCQTGHSRSTLSQGLFLKWSLAHCCSTTDLCIIYAFVSAIYQPFYTSQLHSTVHLCWWNWLQQR